MNKLLFLKNEMTNNIILYNWMKYSYSNILGCGDIIIADYLHKLNDDIKYHEIEEYSYLIEDMYHIYTQWEYQKINKI